MEEKIESVNLSEIILPIRLIRKVPSGLMTEYQFIPISLSGNILTCAFGEIPLSKVISDIEFSTAYKIKVVLASRDKIKSYLKELFPI